MLTLSQTLPTGVLSQTLPIEVLTLRQTTTHSGAHTKSDSTQRGAHTKPYSTHGVLELATKPLDSCFLKGLLLSMSYFHHFARAGVLTRTKHHLLFLSTQVTHSSLCKLLNTALVDPAYSSLCFLK